MGSFRLRFTVFRCTQAKVVVSHWLGKLNKRYPTKREGVPRRFPTKDRIPPTMPSIALQLAQLSMSLLIAQTALDVRVMNTAHAQIPSRVISIEIQETNPIRAYIAQTAIRHGVDPHLMIDLADIESDFDPKAKNPHSSATGLFQWITSSWKSMCKGDRLDYKDNADCTAETLQNPNGLRHWCVDIDTRHKLEAKGYKCP